jgi:ribonucleoside-diphosphate reductase alpha chain
VAKFTNMIFEPNGMTDDKDIRIAQSLVDYLARRLAIDYLDVETRHALGIKTTAERTAEVNGAAEPARAEPVEAASAAPAAPVPVELQQRPAAPGSGGSAGPAGGSQAPVAAQAPAFTPGMAAVDAPYCSTCGVRMRPAGSCFVCESCGTTSGCS